MRNQTGTIFCNAEHAARTNNEREYKTSLAHLAFIAAWEAEKAKRAVRVNIVLQVFNALLLAAVLLSK